MNELATKLMKLKTPLKAAVTAGVLLAIGGAYYFLYYMDLSDQIAAEKGRASQLETEKRTYESRKQEYVAYRDELRVLQEEQRELLKALPKKAEIPGFMTNVQEQAELSGLEVLSLKIESEVPEELYVRIPVRMEVRGGYHSLSKFFKNVSELRRIVNIEDLALAVERSADESGPKLKVRFIAATFRYQDKAGGT